MKIIFLTVIALLLIADRPSAQNIPAFKNGDHIVFVGNSITCGGRYHSYIWLYYMTRFPNMRMEVYNEGIGGDDVRLISKRLEQVFEHEPTVLTLSFGMNDTGYMDFTIPANQERGRRNVMAACSAYKEIEKAYMRYSKASKILIGSSPYDETGRLGKVPFPGKNQYVQDLSDFMKEKAEANHWGFVDFNRPMVEINLKGQKADSTFTLCGDDRLHPTANGHLIMAYLFLKAQGMAGKPVADIMIDASTQTVQQQENCTVTNLSVSSSLDSISFTYLANSLPYPIDHKYLDKERYTQADALNFIPFMDEMNHEGLVISGLPEGCYQLMIGGKEIVRLSANELQHGINLAAYDNTPQNEQAQKIHIMNEQRWRLEREMREYYCVEYNLMRDRGLLWVSNEVAVDTLLKYQNYNIAVSMAKDYWLRFMYKSVRTENEHRQQSLVNRIYKENKPQALKVELKKLHRLK